MLSFPECYNKDSLHFHCIYFVFATLHILCFATIYCHFVYIFVFVAIMEALIQAKGKFVNEIRENDFKNKHYT